MLNKNSISQHGFKITSRSDDFYSAYKRVSYYCNLDILDASFAGISYMAITDPNLLKRECNTKVYHCANSNGKKPRDRHLPVLSDPGQSCLACTP